MYDKANGGRISIWYRLLTLVVAMLAAGSPALAGELTYSFGGNANWSLQSTTTHDGIDAYQSGPISNSQTSWMETTVTGPGAVRFWWKVSSESCCDSLAIAIDGISQTNIRGEVDWQAKGFAVPSGNHTLRWTYATDGSVLSGSNAGWVDQVSFEVGSNIDVTPPTTTATPAGGTYATNQNVTLTCSDSVGCTGTYYCLGSGCTPATPYSGAVTLTASTALRYYSTDAAGNNEDVKTANYAFDTAPPATSVSPAAGTYVGQRTVSLYCSDSGMGCNGTYYCLSSGCTPTTQYTSPITIADSTDLRYYSTDRGGNSEAVKTATYTITPDTTSPITAPSYPSGTYSDLPVYLTCNDGTGSGCAATYYCLGTNCTPNTRFTTFLEITASTDLRFYSVDRSGNNEPIMTVSYTIDATPPTTTVTSAGGIYTSPQSVALACSDGTGGGCSAIYYCLGKGCSPATAYTGPITISASTYLNFYSSDIAFNHEQTRTERYTIRTTPPATINVPTDQATIQAAINAAIDGDTVLVAPGRYVENIDFKGKAITVISSDGPDVTVVDGNQAGTVATFSTGEERTTILDGFTIRNGKAGWVSPSYGDGGGIYISYASPTIINNKIIANSASWGGGIDVEFGSPLIRANIITLNHSDSYGGGIEIGGTASAQVINNTITDNSSDDGGGIGMWAAGTPTIAGNTIKRNSAQTGGGIHMVNGSDPLIIQNLIADNVATNGSAVYWLTPSGSRGPILTNNTIADTQGTQGSVVYADGYDVNAQMTNNIVIAAGNRTAVYCGNFNDLNPPRFSHNVVYSATGMDYDGICSDQNDTHGNITADPQLSNAALGYYGLRLGSPAIDAGDSTASSLQTTDFGGMPRLVDGSGDGTTTVDIGAYEFDPAYPVADLQGVPTSFLATDALTLTVGGADVVSYRYTLDGGAFTDTDISVATPIVLTGLANGQHTIVVLGKDALGREQLLSSATAATWVVNTETTSLTFTYGGVAPWFIQPLVSRDGIAYQSGAITNSQSSWMETTVTGPGAIRFWWKVSSAQYSSPLSFSIDGVSQTNISGGVDWQKQAYVIPAGSHTLRWTYSAGNYYSSVSNAGWVDQIAFEAGSNIDAASPTTSTTPAGGLYGTPQSVTLSCTDSSGCNGTFYCLGAGCTPTTPYTGPINVSTPTYLRFYSTDTAGNYELVKTATYAFDTTPPNTSVSLSAGTYEGQRSVSLYCYDSASYCATTYYCLGNGCTPTTAYNSPVTVFASTDLRYYSTDRFGNNEAVKTATYTITPDTSPPTTTTNHPSGIYSNLYVYSSCTDGSGSGCAATYYCLGAGCTPTTRFPGSLSITSSTDLRFYSQDSSGNSEAIKTVSYTIDNTSPTTSVTPAGGIYTSSQSVTLTCSDGTGCSSAYYCLGKGCYPSTQYTGPISITSSTYISYYSRDVANNSETIKTERYIILASPPATINVPAERTTIQAAIDAANDGDTVLVAPGTYVENLDFKGKAITVTSRDGADVTIIDGNRAGTVVAFSSGEASTTVLDGFTIRNGKATSNGGGIYIYNASPLIRNNTITTNSAYMGGGIFVGNGAPLIRNNNIIQNISTSYGGGIHIDGAPAQIVDNVIVDNRSGTGGGVSLWGSATVSGNAIRRNNALSEGGGIIVGSGSHPNIVQNQFVDNGATKGSGLSMSTYASASVVNNTIVDRNTAQGSVVYLASFYADPLFANNIVTAAESRTAIFCSGTILSSQFNHNAVYSTSDSAYGGNCTDQNGSNGNITADPQLNSPAFGYFGLRPGSPAIDAGDNSVESLPVTDLGGVSRLIDGTSQGIARVDIGAYEFDPSEPRVVLSGAPAGATQEIAATITVGGTGIVSYRYALDGGAFTTTDTPVSTPISLTGLTGGIHAVAVIGRTSDREQSISSATVAEWTVDTIAPTTTAMPAGGTYTTSQSVTLTCADGAGSGCSGTFYCLGGNCLPTTPYDGPITIASTTGLRFNSQDAFGNREEIKTAGYHFVGSISGRVTESAAGAGVQGINVSVYNANTGSSVAYGYTDSSGAYQIPQLASGNYKLRFSGYDYVEQWYSSKADRNVATIVAVSAPGVTNGIDVVMIKGGSISGTVTGKDTGTGLQWVYAVAYNAATGAWAGSGSTDAAGAYRISGLAPGDYKLLFDRPGRSDYLGQWYSSKADITSANAVTVTSSNTTRIDVSLQTGGSITGTVVDSVSGAVIPGVTVTAFDAVTGSWIYSGSTNDSGVYRIAGLAGSCKLRFSGSGYVEQWYGGAASQAAATTVVVTAQNVVAGIDVALVKGARITGTVTDSATGAAIQGVSVTALNPVTGSWAGYGSTDSSGAYSIAGLVTGNYKIRFSADEYVEQWAGAKADQSTAVPVAVTAPGSTTDINAVLVKGGSISGTVTDKGTGVAIQGISVSAYNAANGSSVSYGYTDGSGSYHIGGLASGSYKLRFSGGSSARYPVQWYSNKEQQRTADIVEVTAPSSVTGIDMAMEKGGAITGVVTDSATGAGLQGVYVSAYSVASGQWAGSGSTDGTGAYSITGMATGDYKLSFSLSGYVTQWSGGKADQSEATTVTVSAPNISDGVNMALAKGGSISGTIADRVTGVGISGSYLYAIDRVTGEWAASASTDSNGRYTIPGLASGSYRLQIQPPSSTGYLGGWYGGQDGYLCAGTVSVTAPDETSGIDALLDMGGSISGLVTDAANGTGIAGVSVSLSNSSGNTGMTFHYTTTIDATGAYIIGGLPTGEYSLTFSAPGYIRMTSPAAVKVNAPGVMSGVNVSLVRGGGISGRVTDSATGEGVEGVLVEAWDSLAGGGANSTSDYQGNYVITGLPSGSYAITYDARYAGGNYGGGGNTGGVIVSTGTSGFTSTTSTSSSYSVSATTSSSVSAKSVAAPVIASSGATVQSTMTLCTAPAIGSTVPSSVVDPVTVVVPEMTTGIDFSIARLGGIAGRVTDSAGDQALGSISVTAYDSITGAWAGSGATSYDGAYTIGGLPSGSYRLQFSSWQSAEGGYVSSWYGSGTASTVTAEVTVTAPETTSHIDARLARGGAIAGDISVSVCPGPRQLTVNAYDATNGRFAGHAVVDTNNVGRYTIDGLPAGSYKLAIDPGEAGFVRQWYPNKTEAASAEPVTVSPGLITGGNDVTLAAGGGIIFGKVTGSSGCTYPHAFVKLYDWYSGELVAETVVGYDGSYRLAGLPDGTYKLLFSVDRVDRWYRTTGETSQASSVVMSGAAAVTGIDLTVASGPDGDLDASGGPGLLDAIKALRIAVGLETATPEMLAHVDLAPVVDGVSVPDGKIDLADALLILQRVVSAPVVTAAH